MVGVVPFGSYGASMDYERTDGGIVIDLCLGSSSGSPRISVPESVKFIAFLVWNLLSMDRLSYMTPLRSFIPRLMKLSLSLKALFKSL